MLHFNLKIDEVEADQSGSLGQEMEAELERLGMTEVEQPEAPALSMSSRQKVTSVSWNVFAFAGQCEEVETACPTTESPVVSATEA